jgi:MtN3 and saliva related transmembrane protein
VKNIVAVVFGFGMLINACLFVPQAWHLWKAKRAEGVSVLSFAGFNALQLIGAVHGYFQPDHALMLGIARQPAHLRLGHPAGGAVQGTG